MPQSESTRTEETELEIVPDPDADAAAIAVASLRRPRVAEHEEMWAQLFVDGAFADVVRALRLETADGTESTFLARFRVPAIYGDGASHRAEVRFVRAVSRIVPKGVGSARAAFGTPMIQTPEALVEIDFVARDRPRATASSKR